MRRRIPAGGRATLFLAALALLALVWLAAGTAYAAHLGGKIAFVSQGIWVMNGDGTCHTRLTENPVGIALGAGDDSPAWSPDGRWIAFSRSADIYVMDAGGRDQTNLTGGEPTGSLEHPTWSPDGAKLAFARPTSNAPTEIWTMNADGSDKTRVAEYGWAPAWSPDGEKIAFIALADDLDDVWVMNPDGSDRIILTEQRVFSGDLTGPAWSPDGERIAFISNIFDDPGGRGLPKESHEIYVMNADGSGLHVIEAASGTGVPSPTWGPGGEWIAFGRSGIEAIRADGTEQVRLSSGGGSPDWHADDLSLRAQVCFEGLTRDTTRGVADVEVRVPGPGRVVLRPRPGVKRFVRAHRESESGRVVLKVRPRGKASRRLNNWTNRVRVRAQVAYRPWVGEPVTKGRRVWLVKR